MSFTMNLYYTGEDDNAQKFVQEMEKSGIADQIRKQPGNLRYEYFQPLNDPQTVLADRQLDQPRGFGRRPRLADDGQACPAAGKIQPAHAR